MCFSFFFFFLAKLDSSLDLASHRAKKDTYTKNNFLYLFKGCQSILCYLHSNPLSFFMFLFVLFLDQWSSAQILLTELRLSNTILMMN